MYQNVSKYIRLYQDLSKMYPFVSKCIQNLNLTFKVTNKDNTIFYNLDNLPMPIIKEEMIKITN